MGKVKIKKRKIPASHSKPHQNRARLKPAAPLPAKFRETLPQKHQLPTIPFDPEHRILLVGEGDFSFSRSLLEQYGCMNLHPTSFDTRSAALSKYPQVAANTRILEEEETCKVEYGIDATKLGKSGGGGGGKEVKKGGWDRIVFNFPHVGGLTKDVNRQVRANQELLVNFFKYALPLLAPGGQIVLTIFEGEPYELWNTRDLARHAGLKVERSFKFQACAYSGYKHARTLGNIEGGGGWKGENRLARTYVFASNSGQEPQISRKRQRNESDSEDE